MFYGNPFFYDMKVGIFFKTFQYYAFLPQTAIAKLPTERELLHVLCTLDEDPVANFNRRYFYNA